MMYKNGIKILLDFWSALIAFILLLPLFLLILICLVFINKGKPFYLQKRPGKNERMFYIIKFKTMNDKKDGNGQLLSDLDRMTSFGKFVRTTSLDELPQLLNVIKGDMSIVGPRPLLPEYLTLYNTHQKKRHLVKPGITGWAQVNGRNAITWEQKFKLDVYYVDRISFAMDLKILLKTVFKVFLRSDINSNSAVTMEPFKGTK